MSEELFDTLQGPRNRVQTTRGLATARQSDVNALGGELGAEFRLLESRFASIENLCYTLLGNVDQRTDLRTLFGRQVTQGLHHLSQLALLAKEVNPDLFQGIDVFSVLHGLKCLRNQRIQVFHVQTPDTK
ncbi:hypothetical protein PBOI14_26340 [Pseudomonas sp. Boi14]|nr:hypothetical protein PBOI14_26340 [Pseudomonas sp. Boi14]